MKMTVSGEGRVTIPKPLRDRLGIRPGQILEVREETGLSQMIIYYKVDAKTDASDPA